MKYSKYFKYIASPLLAILILAYLVYPVFAYDITAGTGASNLGGSSTSAGYTVIDMANPVSSNGTVTQIEMWYATNATGVNVGTFYGTAGTYTCRASVAIGSVTSGSKQTFAVNLPVQSGDYVGWYTNSGLISMATSGGTGEYYILGDKTGGGSNAYSYQASYRNAVGFDGWVIANPLTSTLAASSITDVTATLTGNITDLRDNGSNAGLRGFEWGTTSNTTAPASTQVPKTTPYSSNYSETGSYGIGSFTHGISSLSRGTTYYFRAYGNNTYGYGYGSEANFLTAPAVPTTLTTTAFNTTAIQLDWTKGDGAYKTPIWYKTTAYPTSPGDGTLACNTTGTTAIISGLDYTLTYYFSAWSWSENSTLGLHQYSSTYLTASGAPVGLPSVTTLPCSGFTASSGILNGQLTSTPDTILAYGFDYGVDTSYGSSITYTATLNAGDKFWLNAINLNAGSVYHFRAKVQVAAGWAHGQDVVFSTKGSPVAWEYLNTGGDSDSAPTYYANMTAMQFTVGATSHTVTSIRIPLKKTGTTPGTARLSLFHADGSFKPTGNEIAYGTLDANYVSSGSYVWYSFTLNAETNIQAGQMYALVLKLQGDSSNYVTWETVSGGGLSAAVYSYSVDSGISWTVASPKDAMFEVWGNSAIVILDAKVFQSYSTTGDWLVCAEAQNTYLPYYPTTDAALNFSVQLINGSTVVASTSLKEFGRRPIAILLNKATADTLTWGSSLKVRITLNSSTTQYSEYVLTSTDWQAGGNTYVDNWVRYTAADIQTYDTTITGTTQSYLIQTDLGNQLTYSGGQIYTNGIPLIMSIRPNLFQITTTTVTRTPVSTTNAWDTNHNLSDSIGPFLYGLCTVAAKPSGTDAKTVFVMFTVVLGLIAMLFIFKAGTGFLALVPVAGIVVMDWWLGAIDFPLMLIIAIPCLFIIAVTIARKVAG
jgi:hypothetical protein